MNPTLKTALCSALLVSAAALTALPLLPAVAATAPPPSPAAGFREAPRVVQPERAPIIASARAGKRVVAVGDYGIVILTDDGKAFRQARAVPTRAVLTSVFFIDDKRGWAAGHDGTVIGTGDGGETWQMLREEPGKERVLLSVWFETPQRGFAIGQFGLVVETEDGGKTWKERRLVEDRDTADKHLMQIVSGTGSSGLVFIAAEAGTIFRSTDAGRSWQAIQTDNKGSFWTGVVLGDGTALIGGMRGHIYRSSDAGASWKEVPSETQQSLTGAIVGDDGSVRFYGMSGAVVSSRDQGQTFTSQRRTDRANLTTVAAGPAGDLLFTLFGMVPAK